MSLPHTPEVENALRKAFRDHARRNRFVFAPDPGAVSEGYEDWMKQNPQEVARVIAKTTGAAS